MLPALVGTLPRGVLVTSGAVSAVDAIDAGDITINTVELPAIAAAADAEERVDQLVAAVNALSYATGVYAVKKDADQFELHSGVELDIVLGVTATATTCGLTDDTTAVTPVVLASGKRKQFGKNVTPSDADVVKIVDIEVDVKSLKAMGVLGEFDGTDIEISPAATPTRTDN